MNLIKVEGEKNKKEIVRPMFGTAADLAKAVLTSWLKKNGNLLIETDNALRFIFSNIPVEDKTAIEAMMYNFKYKKYLKVIDAISRELQFLSNEIENLIGLKTYMRAGVRHKFKTKKLFDDKLEEYREITTMLAGILTNMDYYNPTDASFVYNFEHERELINKIMLEPQIKHNYYLLLIPFLSNFKFE